MMTQQPDNQPANDGRAQPKARRAAAWADETQLPMSTSHEPPRKRFDALLAAENISPEDKAAKTARITAHRRRRERTAEVHLDAQGTTVFAGDTDFERLDNHVKTLASVGSASPAFVSQLLTQIECVTRKRGSVKTEGINAGLAFLGAINPDGELEAAIGVQMYGTHVLAMELLDKARHAERTEQLETYTTLATKLSRTFAAQVEALARLRGKGQQTVEVRHTYVNAQNAVVGDIHHTGGGGEPRKLAQPHAGDVIEHIIAASVHGADTERDALPIGTGQGAQAMPDARRDLAGRTKRARKSRVQDGILDEGGEGASPGGGGSTGVGSRPAADTVIEGRSVRPVQSHMRVTAEQQDASLSLDGGGDERA